MLNHSTAEDLLKLISDDESSTIKKAQNFIFIPDNYEYIRINLCDILFIEADGSYAKIYTIYRVHQLSTNLKSIFEQFEHPDFIRISRKHIINMRYTERINGISLIVKSPNGVEHKIPFSKRKRQGILNELPVIKIKH